MSLALEVFLAVVMLLTACLFVMIVAMFGFQRLAKARPPISYSIYHRPYLGGKTWIEPLLDETDRFIEEMDKKLEQPPMWRHVK